MRYFNFILITGTLFISCCSNKIAIQKQVKVDLLTDRSTEIGLILHEVRVAYELEHKLTNQVFILRTEKVLDSIEVIISVYDAGDLKYCNQPIFFPLFGLYKFDAIQVLVYGDDSKILFDKKGEQIEFDLLSYKRDKTLKNKRDIPYPPEFFEPIVWIFIGTSENLTFREHAQFNVIE